MYGDEPWRLKKLRATKAKYDPNNAFGFYNPIIWEKREVCLRGISGALCAQILT